MLLQKCAKERVLSIIYSGVNGDVLLSNTHGTIIMIPER